MLAYASRKPDGTYDPFVFQASLKDTDLEFSDDVFVICKESAEAYLAAQRTGQPMPPASSPTGTGVSPSATTTAGGGPGAPAGIATIEPPKPPPAEMVPGFRWTGDITPQKWMNFYMKVLAGLASTPGLKLSVTIDAQPHGGVSKAKIEEIRIALRELGMMEEIDLNEGC